MPVTLDQNENFCLLHLEGEIDISSATELKTLLLQGWRPDESCAWT